jgi:arginyl-tRNA--protein-N-Asp/Glu arginylyltransferase
VCDTTGSWGTYSVLSQIEQTKALKLRHVYLGYWIERSPKMAYKSQFRPYPLLLHGQWQTPPPAPSTAYTRRAEPRRDSTRIAASASNTSA